MTTKEFIEAFHGKDEPIYLNVARKTWKNKPRVFDQQTEELLHSLNESGLDICFIVNSGGTRDAVINRINAVFVDWDCGKDPQGKYFDIGIVNQKKLAFQEKIRGFPLQPSMIVETRNGYHLYWLLDPGTTSDQFRCIQSDLATYFEGDPRVGNPARVMRLPGFNWVKPGSGMPTFFVQVISSSKKRYRLNEIEDALRKSGISGGGSIEADASVITTHNKTGVNTHALIVGSNPQDIQVDRIHRVKTEIDLASWLSAQTGKSITEGTCCCPFHGDINPSAGVFRGAKNVWIFRCHVCGVSGSIIDMGMKVWKCSQSEAISRLIGSAKKDPTELKDLLEKNVEVINQLSAERSPYACRLIGRIKNDLVMLQNIAQTAVIASGWSVEGEPLFFGSLRWLVSQRKSSGDPAEHPNRFNQRIDRFCMLGLLKKLRDEQIPSQALAEAKKRQGHRPYRMQFYSIPRYDETCMAEAERRAEQFIQAGCSVSGVSYQLIARLFGKEQAELVYPQGVERDCEALTASESAVESVVLEHIEKRGYTTIKELLEAVSSDRFAFDVRRSQVERALPAILERNQLCRCTAGKQLKLKYGILAIGYPRIITKVKGQSR